MRLIRKVNILDTSIEFLKGVGPARAELMRSEMGVRTYGDLLQYYPFRHIDRSKFYAIKDIDPEAAMVQVTGRFIRIDALGPSFRVDAVVDEIHGRAQAAVLGNRRQAAMHIPAGGGTRRLGVKQIPDRRPHSAIGHCARDRRFAPPTGATVRKIPQHLAQKILHGTKARSRSSPSASN